MSNRAHFRVLNAAVLALSLFPTRVLAHCDTMDGPVVRDAQLALASRDARVVLKWVKPEKASEVSEVFQHTLAVRELGPEARALADRYFFETLVRIHREGEGAPYTGLKLAGVEIGPAIAASDKALETGSVEALVRMVAAESEFGIRERFASVVEARKHRDESVERGRDYVAAYVRFMHYAERLHTNAAWDVGHAEHEAQAAEAHHR